MGAGFLLHTLGDAERTTRCSAGEAGGLKNDKPLQKQGLEQARRTGIEPATFGSTVRCSNQLSYRPKMSVPSDSKIPITEGSNDCPQLTGRQANSSSDRPNRSPKPHDRYNAIPTRSTPGGHVRQTDTTIFLQSERVPVGPDPSPREVNEHRRRRERDERHEHQTRVHIRLGSPNLLPARHLHPELRHAAIPRLSR